MTLAETYARALHDLVTKNPAKQKEYIEGLGAALERRGHKALLPRIYAAYQLLDLHNERKALHAAVTPEKERNRILLELYHKLVSSK